MDISGLECVYMGVCVCVCELTYILITGIKCILSLSYQLIV